MTNKQFTALVASICVTAIALMFWGLTIGVAVESADVSGRLDNITEEHGGIGALAGVAYLAMSGFLAILFGIGGFLHSAVGLMTALASVKAESKGARITSIVLISLNGAILLVVAIPLLVGIIF